MGLVKCDLGPISVEKKRRHNPLAIACVGLWHTRREQRPALGRVLPATRLPLKQYVCWSVQHIEKIFFFYKKDIYGPLALRDEDANRWQPLNWRDSRPPRQKLISLTENYLSTCSPLLSTDWSCLLAVSQILTIPSQARSHVCKSSEASQVIVSGPWLMVGQQLQRETLK